MKKDANISTAVKFKELRVIRKLPCTAFELYVAVWCGPGEEIVIGAPSLEALRSAWLGITKSPLISEGVDHTAIIRFKKSDRKKKEE